MSSITDLTASWSWPLAIFTYCERKEYRVRREKTRGDEAVVLIFLLWQNILSAHQHVSEDVGTTDHRHSKTASRTADQG